MFSILLSMTSETPAYTNWLLNMIYFFDSRTFRESKQPWLLPLKEYGGIPRSFLTPSFPGAVTKHDMQEFFFSLGRPELLY